MAKRKNKQKYAPTPNKYLELLSDELRGELPRSNRYLELLSDELKQEITKKKAIMSLSNGAREKMYDAYKLRTTPVCWGVPCDEVMYTKFFTGFIRQGIMPWDDFATTESTYLPEARNEIHNNFINDSEAEYLMMQDSDILAPPDIVTKLLKHDKHLVGGWYKNKNSYMPPHPIVYDFVNESSTSTNFIARQEPGEGLEKVDGMGAGCWLMSKELALALGINPYSMEKGGEDLWLSKKVMDLGYEMWVDWDLPVAHMGVSWC